MYSLLQQSSETSNSIVKKLEKSLKMPAFEKRMEKKMKDLEESVEFLKAQNIMLLECLDQTRQNCETQQEQIIILSRFLKISLIVGSGPGNQIRSNQV